MHLVRHGSYEDGDLTQKGQDEAKAAATVLAAKGLGQEALILCGAVPSLIQTAEIIAAGLGTDSILHSRLMAKVGQDPELVESLARLVDAILADQGIDKRPTELVIVTHLPLISVAACQDPHDVPPGIVVPVDPRTWNNPGYDRYDPHTVELEAGLGWM